MLYIEPTTMQWIRERSLTLSMMGLFLIFLAGQLVSGFYDYNSTRVEHGEAAVSAWAYGSTGHLWEATFENWESEFLQMAVFIVFTTRLIQKGSPESRRPGAVELVDVDPRDFKNFPNVPWPSRVCIRPLPSPPRSARRMGAADLRTFPRAQFPAAVPCGVGGPCLGRLPRNDGGTCGARTVGRHVRRVPGLIALLVRVVSELAERIPVDRRHGLARGLSATERLAGVQTGACTTQRDRKVRVRGSLNHCHLCCRARMGNGPRALITAESRPVRTVLSSGNRLRSRDRSFSSAWSRCRASLWADAYLG